MRKHDAPTGTACLTRAANCVLSCKVGFITFVIVTGRSSENLMAGRVDACVASCASVPNVAAEVEAKIINVGPTPTSSSRGCLALEPPMLGSFNPPRGKTANRRAVCRENRLYGSEGGETG